MTIKCLFLVETCNIGGAERHALSIIQALKGMPGMETHLIITDQCGPLSDQFRTACDRFYTTEHLHLPQKTYPWHRPTPTLEILSHIEDYINIHQIDIVHIFNAVQYVPSVPDHVPVILHVGGDLSRDVYYHRVNLASLNTEDIIQKRAFLDWFNAKPKAITISDTAKNRNLFQNCLVIRNYTPYLDVGVGKKPGNTCCWVGRYSEEKNLGLVLELAKTLTNTQFHLVISVESHINPPKIEQNNVILTVNATDMRGIAMVYEGSDILLNTSITEGEPLTITEGHMHGCFVIGGPAVRGLADCVVEDLSVSGFADKIRGFLGSTAKQRQFYEVKARSRHPASAQKLVIDELVRLYKRLVKC